jgi:hypothetical protein
MRCIIIYQQSANQEWWENWKKYLKAYFIENPNKATYMN